MINVQDLKIRAEILPLFDCSLNIYAKNQILEILETPLKSKEEVILRQNILKGFISNHKILREYSYPALYLNEVYDFLTSAEHEDFSEQKLKFKFFTSRSKKGLYVSKLNQLVLFFYKLEAHYFSWIDLKLFPASYSKNISKIINFLKGFDLDKNEKVVREKGLKDSEIIKLSHLISKLSSKETLSHFWNELFLFEAYLAISISVVQNEFTFPSFTDKRLNLTKFYHPLLENPVKNDLNTTSNVVVLNGPNMSGKSTMLRAVGLCMYLGHLGFGIPAAAGEIPFCTDFSIDINRRDDIHSGYSHFMTEIINLKEVVKSASDGNSSFAVFDELFNGTNVEDALEICRVTINGLSKFDNSIFFISTHIQELRDISNPKISTYHIDCKLMDDKPTFTYELKDGWSDIRVGRILFQKEGLYDLL